MEKEEKAKIRFSEPRRGVAGRGLGVRARIRGLVSGIVSRAGVEGRGLGVRASIRGLVSDIALVEA